MEQDIHPERPRPVEPKPPRHRPAWLEPAGALVLPAIAANATFSVLLNFAISETIWFGVAASALAVWSLRLENPQSTIHNPKSENRLPILAALIGAFTCFLLALKIAVVFAAVGIAALAFAIRSLSAGVEASRRGAWSFAFLLFAFPWADPEANLLSYPWRDLLAGISAAVSRPLVGVVTAQGTTLGAESIKIALTPPAAGLWQMQFFVLCALGLSIGSGWKTPRRLLWLGVSAVAAIAACLGFAISFLVISVLAAEVLTPAWSGVLQIGWWAALFGLLCWLSLRGRCARAAGGSSKKISQRVEAMFPDDAFRKS